MKVLHIAKFYPPDKGGVETATKSIVEYLWDRKIATDVLCFTSQRDDVERHAHGTLFKFKCKLKLLSTPFSLDYLSFLLNNIQKYSVIHLHAPNPTTLLFLFCIRPWQKLIIHWHADVINQKKSYMIYKFFEKLMLNRANHIIVGTEEYFNHSTPLLPFKDKTHFIAYGVTDPEIKVPKVFKDEVTVISVGRLVPYKGYEALVEAARFVNSKVKIILIGDGPDKSKLLTIIKEFNLRNVEIKSGVENLEPYLKSADIFCLPSISRAESFGISLIEAMSYKIPLITSDNTGSGMNFINKHGETGYIVKKESPTDIASAINELSDSLELRKKFSENSYERFKKYFEYSSVLKKYAEIYT
jgi:glycosyltransferase involved in cell wall biosynthesis